MSVLGGQQSVQYGTSVIYFDLIYSDRKTLAIHVYPDGSVVVDAPTGSSVGEIERHLLKRGGWILRQQRHFEDYASPNPLPRRYISGEAYRYLGRQYRLKVVEDQIERVRLSRGFLTVNVSSKDDKSRIAYLIDQWYLAQARRVLEERLTTCYPRIALLGVEFPAWGIRDLKSRWGNCTPLGRLTFNVKLIQVPKDLIDYVVLHELCHLKEHNHGPAYYALLDRVLPDWRVRRQRLNRAELT